ncbi:MAG: DUF4230 domain-containing protein [Eubacteriales bacterium]|nr:DUF4230 domain-containing protein [Eubacteriales bacterium]
MKKVKFICLLAAALLFAAAGFAGARYIYREPEPVISTAAIEEKLIQCSLLTTARLEYRGLVQYSEGEIPLINKKGFSMIYDAQICAGIDLSQADIAVDGDTIRITLPKPSIQSIEINPDTVEFYDEQYALFNWTNKEDVTTAMEYARQDAQVHADSSELLAQAKEQAHTVIETLLIPITDDSASHYKLEIK